MMSIPDIILKQLEAKKLKFAITNSATGATIDASGATMSFGMKLRKADASYTIEKTHGDFDMTDAANGYVYASLSTTDLDITEADYYGELKTQLSASNIDKSDDLIIRIEKAVIVD